MPDKEMLGDKYEQLCQKLPSFCSEYLQEGLSEKSSLTQIEYAKDLCNFFEYALSKYPYFDKSQKVSDISLEQFKLITVPDVNKYLRYLKDQKLSESLRARRRTSLTMLYNYLVYTQRILEYNPVLGSVKVHVHQKDYVNYLTEEEQTILMNGITYGTGLSKRALQEHHRYMKRDKAIVFLILDMGLRLSELVGINIKDIDLSDHSVAVERKGHNSKDSKLWFSNEAGKLVSEYIEERKSRGDILCGDDPLFVTLKGTRLAPRSVEQMVDKYVSAVLPEKASIISVHKLRSSFAMTYYRAPSVGGNILELQRKLGHSDIRTTQIYAKACDNEINANRNWKGNGKS